MPVAVVRHEQGGIRPVAGAEPLGSSHRPSWDLTVGGPRSAQPIRATDPRE